MRRRSDCARRSPPSPRQHTLASGAGKATAARPPSARSARPQPLAPSARRQAVTLGASPAAPCSLASLGRRGLGQGPWGNWPRASRGLSARKVSNIRRRSRAHSLAPTSRVRQAQDPLGDHVQIDLRGAAPRSSWPWSAASRAPPGRTARYSEETRRPGSRPRPWPPMASTIVPAIRSATCHGPTRCSMTTFGVPRLLGFSLIRHCADTTPLGRHGLTQPLVK